MARINVPATDGKPAGWFDLRPVGILTPDDADEYSDFTVALYQAKRDALPPLVPANPAELPPEDTREVQLSKKDTMPLYGLVLGWVLEGDSYGLDAARIERAAKEAMSAAGTERIAPLRQVLSEERAKLGIMVWNALLKALVPYTRALNGEGPKGTTPADGTTTGT